MTGAAAVVSAAGGPPADIGRVAALTAGGSADIYELEQPVTGQAVKDWTARHELHTPVGAVPMFGTGVVDGGARDLVWAVTLPRGVSTVRITTLGSGGANVDRIIVTAVKLPRPRPVGRTRRRRPPGPRRRSGPTTGDTPAAGSVDFAPDRPGYVQWTVSVPRAGSYQLTWRYANGSTLSRPVQLSVNGAPRARVVNQPTGSFDRWP